MNDTRARYNTYAILILAAVVLLMLSCGEKTSQNARTPSPHSEETNAGGDVTNARAESEDESKPNAINHRKLVDLLVKERDFGKRFAICATYMGENAKQSGQTENVLPLAIEISIEDRILTNASALSQKDLATYLLRQPDMLPVQVLYYVTLWEYSRLAHPSSDRTLTAKKAKTIDNAIAAFQNALHRVDTRNYASEVEKLVIRAAQYEYAKIFRAHGVTEEAYYAYHDKNDS